MAVPHIKAEPGVKLEPCIKHEPGLSSSDVKTKPGFKTEPGYADDDELYEDAGDLDVSNGDRAVWLVKLPQFLAERWKDIDEDEEIVLGTVKVDRNAPDQKNLKLFLEKNKINGQDIPIEYDLNITNMEVTNTYVFTEKDMPGYESKMETGVKDGDPAIPARFLYQNRQREREKNDATSGGAAGKNWKGGRYTPYVRKAIPKRTALVGTAKHECAVLPVYNDEYRAFQLNRTLREDAPQYSTKFLNEAAVPGNLLIPGTTGGTASFAGFIKPTQPVRKTTDNKSYRIDRADLTTQLFSHFAQHEYWSMKGFREVTNQPEAYLKEVLEEIAVMNRSGPFTGKWSVKEEFKDQISGDTAAPGTTNDVIEIDDDDDDDEVEMEDVLLGAQQQQQ